MKDLLTSRRIGSIDPDAALLDHVEPSALFAGREQNVTGGDGSRDASAGEQVQGIVVQLCEQRNPVQEREQGRLGRLVVRHEGNKADLFLNRTAL